MAVGCVLTGPATTTTTTTTTTVTLDVLSQLVNHTSLYHKLHTVVVVVVLNDVDRRTADQFVQKVITKYLYEVSIGFIQVLQQGRSVCSDEVSVEEYKHLNY